MDWRELQKWARSSAVDIARRSSELAEEMADSKLADQALEATKKLGQQGRRVALDTTNWAQEQYINATEPTDANNWYLRAARACESASDAILRERPGTSTKISRVVAANVGAASTTAGIFSIAALVGSASPDFARR